MDWKMKKNNIISDWLDRYGDPEIEKKVEMKLEEITKERFNQIIDEVYNKYLTKYVGYDDVPSKKLFLYEIKNNTEFSERWGLKIEERELSLEERAKWLQDNKGYDLLVGNLDHDHIREVVEEESPTKQITLEYNQEKIYIYE